MKHYINRIAWVIFVICVIFLIGTISLIITQKDKIIENNIRQEALMAEINNKTSLGNTLGMLGKSFFDGFTFGLFSGGDIFAEAHKMEAWEKDVLEKASWLETERQQSVNAYTAACTGRNWSIIIGVIALLTGIYTKDSKVEVVNSKVVKDITPEITQLETSKKAKPEMINTQINMPYNDNSQIEQQNMSETVKWYFKLAKQGDAKAQYNLGKCYMNGDGVPLNVSEGVKWFHKAAEQGDSEAQFQLSFCYANGKGVEKNLLESVKWYNKAAEQKRMFLS